MESTAKDIAGFYELALTLGLVQFDAVVNWVDGEIGRSEIASEKMINLSLAAAPTLDRSIQLLRDVADEKPPGAGAIRLVAALFWDKVNKGTFDTLMVARMVYSFACSATDVAEVMGDVVFWIDELFEDYGPGSEVADRTVRTMLRPFAGIELPPI